MKKKLNYILLVTLFTKILYSQEFEAGLYSFNFNKKIETSATKVYVMANGKVYVELQNLLKVVGITNNSWIDEEYTIDMGNIYNQEKVINLEKKYVNMGDKKNTLKMRL